MPATPQSPLHVSKAEQAVIGAIAEQNDAMIKSLLSWSKVNSGSHNTAGLTKMRRLLKAHFKSLPGKITDAKLASGQTILASGETVSVNYAPAMRLIVRPEAPIQVVLTGHYDTVFPKDSAFQTPEYLDADTVNGPGVADMKGGIIVMAEALKGFEMSPNASRVGYTVLLSPDEEIGSPGSAEALAKLGRAAHVGLTYEPALADGSLAGARKGSGNFTVVIRGRAAHAGREHSLGRNAINAAARFSVGLDALNGQRDGVTFNMAKIDGGGPVNIVPDLAIARFNIRMKQSDDVNWINQKLTRLIEDLNDTDGITAELSGGFTRPPKPMAPANLTVFNWVKSAGAALGQTIKWAPSGGVCEGNNLWASGCPNVDTLGVRGGDIHSDREYIKLSSLVERAQLSALILMKIASNEFDAEAVKAEALANLAGSST